MSSLHPAAVQHRSRARPSLTATVRRREDQLRLDFEFYNVVLNNESEAIRTAIERVAGALRAVLQTPEKTDRTYSAHDTNREVMEERCLPGRGHDFGAAPFGAGPAILISVAQDPVPAHRRLGDHRSDLTPRETEVLQCLVRGKSYNATAIELGISIDTVRAYVRTIYRKLRVNKAAEAVSRALQEGLV